MVVFLIMTHGVAVGFPQVTVANPEDSHLSRSNRPTRLPRRGDCRLLQRAVDPPHDHLFRPYVPFLSVRGARTNDASSMAGAASFTIYTRTKEFFRDHYLIDHSQLLGCSAVGGIGGAMAGSIISFGSAREFPCDPVVPFSHRGDVDQLSNLSRCLSVSFDCIFINRRRMFAGSTAARIHDCGEEGNQAGQTAKYCHRCT
jgi:hypothetical protein